MGYLTNYDFSGNAEDVIREIEEVSGYASEGDGRLFSVKWYDHTEHMKSISLKFPDRILVLEGEGEEQGDIWKAYFKNGKFARIEAEISFPDFDEKNLK